jgi:ribosome-binding ATPase
VESELAVMGGVEKTEYLADLGVSVEDCGLQALVRTAYAALGLQTYFTAGPTETRAWTVRKGAKAPQVGNTNC